jgi:hypothetical protein
MQQSMAGVAERRADPDQAAHLGRTAGGGGSRRTNPTAGRRRGQRSTSGRPSPPQELYYDSGAEYARLQRIKKYTDPKDLFHTSFTVQLPG